jgi:hypothetical protein
MCALKNGIGKAVRTVLRFVPEKQLTKRVMNENLGHWRGTSQRARA